MFGREIGRFRMTLHVRFNNIPANLRARKQWCLWRWIMTGTDLITGKETWTKPPFQSDGTNAKSSDPRSWASFDQVLAAFHQGGFSGIGYMLSVDRNATDDLPATTDDGLAGVDLDHCIDEDTGAVQPWAKAIIEQLDSYTEISPSGTGLRVFLFAKLPPKDRKIGNFECYEDGRYLTVTGNHLPDTPLTIEHRQEQMTAVHTAMFAERNKSQPHLPVKDTTRPIYLDDSALLELAFGAKNGDVVRRLYEGDASNHNSGSEADLALCSHLAFYSSGDPATIDRLFRNSALYREKWDEHRGAQTYGEMTIAKAVEGVTEFYSPGHRSADDSVYSVYSVYGWETPQPFESVDVPTFPVDALPPELAEYVAQEAEAKQVPVDLPVCLSLGAIATATAGKCRVFINEEWEEPLNNFFVCVLPSGERKSPEVREIFRPLEEFEKELVAAKTPEIMRCQTEWDILDKRLQSLKTIAAKANPTERISAEADARELSTALAQFKVPPVPCLLADDATPEAVAGLLAEQGGRISIVSTEGGIFEMIAGRYSDKVPNLDVYLKAYSGDTIRVHRRSRPAEFIADPCLTVVITVQPDVIHDLASNHSFRGRGFLARWSYSLPTSMVGFRKINPPPVQPQVRAHWREMLKGAASLPYPVETKPPQIFLSPEAKDLFHMFRSEVEIKLRPGGELYDIADWGNKLCGNVARYAGLLHSWISVSQADRPWETPITGETMANAIAIGNYFEEHAKAAFASMGADPRLASAKKVWAAIIRHDMTEFSVRDLYQLVRRTFKTVADLETILGLLVEFGYLRGVIVSKQEGPGQSPSPRYEVNPLARTQNTQGTQNSESVGVTVVADAQINEPILDVIEV